jgi:hypothetical protein
MRDIAALMRSHLAANVLLAGALLAFSGVNVGCAQPAQPQRGNQTKTSSPTVVASSPLPVGQLVLNSEPWTLEAGNGQVMTTPSFRVYTTATKAAIIDRLPAFIESAFSNYVQALGQLPAPDSPMEIYLMDNRAQWERMTQRFMGDQADTYLRIQRGGFTYDGHAILYDIGRRDTFTILAHEGWHVYTQRTFRNVMPVWLEEGVATYMEGFRWDPSADDRPTFLPWANFERFDQLRWGVRASKLMPLDQLTKSTPQELIAGDPNSALFYYAQVWALIHFLNEGENGAYAASLRSMIADAASGKLVPRIRRELGDHAASTYVYRRRGVDLLKLYTGKSAAELDVGYAAFMDKIVQTGTRQQIWQGKSPMAIPEGP